MGVKQLLAEMLQMPLLGSSIFAITSQAAAKARKCVGAGYAFGHAWLSASELCLSGLETVHQRSGQNGTR